jgi:hypothetical protein
MLAFIADGNAANYEGLQRLPITCGGCAEVPGLLTASPVPGAGEGASPQKCGRRLFNLPL